MFIKKNLIIVAVIVVFFTFAVPVSANPYSLYGQGNCALFAYEMMSKFWPTTFTVYRHYNAGDWVKLIGQKKKREGVIFEICSTDRPMAGDFIIWPSSLTNPLGHIAFITNVTQSCYVDLELSQFKCDTFYDVLESSNHAEDYFFANTLNGCRYREYWYSNTETDGCIFLTYKKV
ncbi:MAG: CHAP domain-containing protein [Syntrophomonadaceae bacterium]|nr:CHAP domain-containing protein [Syntrophomonadaceae bacterium]